MMSLPEEMRRRGYRKARPIDRFMGHFIKRAADDCWPWKSHKTKSGYGQIVVHGRWVRAHRAAWAVFYREDPGELHVLHRCDNPECVNPAHLFLGTAADNARDKAAKGRSGGIKRAGENNCNAKLTEDDVRAIRRSTETGGALARRLGVSKEAVNYARRGTTWRHIE